MSNLDNSRTKNLVSNLVSQARESDQDDEDRKLVSCDLCFQPLRRCVGVSCCPASLVCRICAVAHISRHAHCWVCGAKADTQVRGYIIIISFVFPFPPLSFQLKYLQQI